jgi:hypothetical protein
MRDPVKITVYRWAGQKWFLRIDGEWRARLSGEGEAQNGNSGSFLVFVVLEYLRAETCLQARYVIPCKIPAWPPPVVACVQVLTT